ncbi:glycosyltransferase family A protein [Haloprofundus salilacus]|uniref:glycosyltransferase family A protein n=1 Tax=Haloprofundus salilacus TaxID=2876190 RepID=UPI001CCEA6AB|nr:glycosyltransferase family A protein [Haloprofundus salilacus]
MASVILPTTTWTDSCESLAAQLGPEDELLVVCDRSTDPVASHDAPAGVRILVAGEPVRCSAKANALAYALERIGREQERIVLTDDDVPRDDEWLERMKSLGEEHGAASALPAFVGDGFWRLVEPFLLFVVTLAMWVANAPWGGGVTFRRDQLDIDAYISDLRRTVSDDDLLWEYLGDELTTPRSELTLVPVEGDARAVHDRFVRFVKIVTVPNPVESVVPLVSLALVTLGCLLAPFVAASALTAASYLTYRFFGIDRSTWLLAYPSALFVPLAFCYAVVVPTFRWNGRRYRWRSTFDVTVVD